MSKTPLKSARRRASGNGDNAPALPTVPQAEQNQKKRTIHALPKPVKLIRYRQKLPEIFAEVGGFDFLGLSLTG
jgi:hypothetical protein